MALLFESKDILVIQDTTLQLEDELPGDSLIFFLTNFALNGDTLRADHLKFIREMVAPNLVADHRVCEVYAMADRSGTPEVNFKMSRKRLEAVQRAMLSANISSNKVFTLFFKALGEEFADHKKVPDGTKDPQHRSVLMAVSSSPLRFPTRTFVNNVFGEIISFGRQFEPKP